MKRNILSYKVKITFESQDDRVNLLAMLKRHTLAWNEAAQIMFEKKCSGLVELHKNFYRQFRDKNLDLKAQVPIVAQKDVIRYFKSVKARGTKMGKPPVKVTPSMKLDIRLYRFRFKDGIPTFFISTMTDRIKCVPILYDKIRDLVFKNKIIDPILSYRDGEFYLQLSFDSTDMRKPVAEDSLQERAIGVDLGMRVSAVTSDGAFILDKKFLKEKRQLRFLKDRLKSKNSKGSRAAKKHLHKLKRKESNKNKDHSHRLANSILKCSDSKYIVIEDLRGVGRKKGYENKNKISQVSFHQISLFLKYKAPLLGKTVITINPEFTSQIDHRSGKKDGKRCGRRYYCSDGTVLDADHNAAINIALRSQHPVSQSDLLDGQAIVNSPNAINSNVRTYSYKSLPEAVGQHESSFKNITP